jgi:Rieske Fe-S protein
MSDDSNRIDVTRRQLLRGAAAAAAVTGASSALAACTGGGGGMLDGGPASGYSVGTVRLVGGTHFVLRDASGFYAFTATCTHEGCIVNAPTAAMPNFSCPCHLSQYDLNGHVQAGSLAMRDLAHFAVAINSGNVMVDTSMTVPAATRTPAG